MAISNKSKGLLALATVLVVLFISVSHNFTVDIHTLASSSEHQQQRGLDPWNRGELGEHHGEVKSKVIKRAPPKQASEGGSAGSGSGQGGSRQGGSAVGGQGGSQGSGNAGSQDPSQQQRNPAGAGQAANAAQGLAQGPPAQPAQGQPAQAASLEDVGRGLMSLMLHTTEQITPILGFNPQTKCCTGFSQYYWVNEILGPEENIVDYVTTFFRKVGREVPDIATAGWKRHAYRNTK